MSNHTPARGLTVTVVDVGLGNIASVSNMLRRVGAAPVVVKGPEGLHGSDAVVLPGVGAFDTGIRRLQEARLFEPLQQLSPDFPILGICLGMQLLARRSEEGTMKGLGRVEADFVRFPAEGPPVPHMGWNTVDFASSDPVTKRLSGPQRYYFTHSYFAVCDEPGITLGTAEYGLPFVAAYRSNATYGVQFHPEKSHRFGMEFLNSWLETAC